MNSPFDSMPLPDWAIEHARVSLRMEVSASDIEQRLVARGLTPTAAAAVVKRACEDQVRQQREAEQRAKQRLRLHRILSGVVACACFVLAYWFNGVESVRWTGSWILLPLACIWFGDQARIWFGYADPTPDGMIRLGGWLALLAIGMYRLILVLNMA